MKNNYYIEDISNDKVFTEIQRKCAISVLIKNGETQTISAGYQILYFKDEIEITEKFSPKTGVMVADNATYIFYDKKTLKVIPTVTPIYEEVTNTIVNEDGIEEDIVTQVQTNSDEQIGTEIGYYDYMMLLDSAGVKDRVVLSQYIKEYDNDGKFD